MTPTALLVVPTERHVERAGREGIGALTWARLRERLAAAFLPRVVWAAPETTRIALAEVASGLGEDEPLLARVRASGAAAWEGTLDAIDEALGELYAADVAPEALAELERAGGAVGERARFLRVCLERLEARLHAAGLVDGRRVASSLAWELARHTPAEVAQAVGTPVLVARFLLHWDPADAALWRALAASLDLARVELPSFASPLDATRERDPLERIFDASCELLGEPPETAPIARTLGDFTLLGGAEPDTLARVDVGKAASSEAQARAAVVTVLRALAKGAPIERVAVAVTRIDEQVLVPLRRLFDEARIPVYDARGPAPTGAGIVAFALELLELGARGLPRRTVARVLRSSYLDARRVTGLTDPRRARGALERLATALEQVPTAHGDQPVDVFVATAATFRAERIEESEERAALAGRIAAALMPSAKRVSRKAHVAAARALLGAFGLRFRVDGASRDVLAKDDAPTGVARAELLALAADSHAWDVLEDALARYELAAAQLGAEERCTSSTFVHELRRALEAGPPPPGGGRVGAVRIARLGELAGEELDLLVVVDANEGALPVTEGEGGLVTRALASALRKRSVRAAPVDTELRSARQLGALALAASGAARIQLLFRSADDGGAVLAPAPLVLWLVRSGVLPTSWSEGPLASHPLSERERDLVLMASAPDRARRLAPAAARRALVESVRERFHEGFRPTDLPMIGRLDEDRVLCTLLEQETGGGARPLSVTAVERMAECSFQGFARQVLRATEDAALEDTPDRREEGIVVHDVLRAIFEACVELWPVRPRDGDSIRARARETLDAIFASPSTQLRALSASRVREEALRVVEVAIADEAWDFAAAEREFGSDGGWPAWTVEQCAARVSLRGKIDRYDVAHGRAAVRVIDYKRSVSVKVLPKDLGLTALQVPVYARVTASQLGVPRAEGLYLPTLTPETPATAAFTARWEEILREDDEGLARIDVTVLDVVRKLRAGDVSPEPISPSVCERCHLEGGCRRPRFAVHQEETEDA